jgi:TonB family protein
MTNDWWWQEEPEPEMESPAAKVLKLLVEYDPASSEFRSGLRAVLHPENTTGDGTSDLWPDVFVQQELPWARFAQSAVLHAAVFGLLWMVSLSWMRQQKILDRDKFDRSSLITYSPQEYLPPLDTGASAPGKAQTGDPAYAKQPILSVPREANSRSQSIVVPPDVKLDQDVPMPNIVAAGSVVPSVPLDATRASLSRTAALEAEVVPPAPEVQFARDRVVRSAMNSQIIAPPPEVAEQSKRGFAGPATAVVEPPPPVTRSIDGRVGTMNIGSSAVVAPAPQLAVEPQHAMASRGAGHMSGGSVQPVGPPPSVSASGNTNSGGRLIALGIHPVTANGPVAVPAGNRRGTFAATPQGRAGASGTPELSRGNSNAGGLSNRENASSLPSGLHVGAVDAGSAAGRDETGVSKSHTGSARAASEVSDDKITDFDRQVFHGNRPYTMTLNMPNLNSSTGSWEIRFAEMESGKKVGDLLGPVATEKSDPGYPLELIRSNVHGMVTLYAVIGADGKVAGIRVLNSPDDRLDSYAKQALARCKFAPAERAGKPVALEAVVRIPFRVRRSF